MYDEIGFNEYARRVGIPEWLVELTEALEAQLPEDKRKVWELEVLSHVRLGHDYEISRHWLTMNILKQILTELKKLGADEDEKDEPWEISRLVLQFLEFENKKFPRQ